MYKCSLEWIRTFKTENLKWLLPQSHYLAVLFRKETKDEVVMETSVTPGVALLTHTVKET